MNWKVLNNFKPDSVEEIIKILLENRGLKTKKEIEEFLNPQNPIDFTAKDLGIDEKELEKAVKRINKAIKNNEGIIVYGDYDADGICATAILWETLYKLTKNVLPYIPERISEGYGLNKESISQLKTSAFAKPNLASADRHNPQLKLIITVDHGITAADKIKYAQELGVDVIVCDHHQVGKEGPECTAVVHAEKICAAAIAWFVSMSLRGALPRGNPLRDEIASHSLAMTEYLDLVAIATIADLEPLIGANRSFAKHGLEALNKTKRCGLLAIFEEAGLKPGNIGTYEVGYIIAPRLNAMGRMEHALESLRLVCTQKSEQARLIAQKLGATNRERQLLTEETTRHAVESSKFIPPSAGQSSKLIFIGHESYNQGIIGLVASKLVEQYCRPSIVLSIGELYSKASARSINGFNIIEAIRLHSDLLVDVGGHPMAAGFTIETTKIEILRQKLMETAEKQIPAELLEKTLKIDLELPLSSLTMALWREIQKMAPFGLGNPQPVFASRMVVQDFRTVGLGGKHLKLELQSDKVSKFQRYSAIGFGMGHLANKLKIAQEIDLAYNITVNEWNAEKRLELKIKDIR